MTWKVLEKIRLLEQCAPPNTSVHGGFSVGELAALADRIVDLEKEIAERNQHNDLLMRKIRSVLCQMEYFRHKPTSILKIDNESGSNAA